MTTGLAAELKQHKPFDSVGQEAVLSILRTAAVIDHTLLDAMKPFGVTPTQYNVLRILRGAGKEGLCRSEVAERLVNQVPDVTRLLDRMEAVGLIERHRSEMDRRFVTTHITEAGLELLEVMDGPLRELHERQIRSFSKKELQTLIDLLQRMRSDA